MNKWQVRGDDFVVAVPDVHRVEYSEANWSAVIEIEGGTRPDGETDFLLYSQSLRGWDASGASISFSSTERHRIIENISKSLLRLEMLHRIE